jgi:hypothetical protein
VDLDASTLNVVRVVIEVDGYVADKPYPIHLAVEGSC